MAGKAKARIKTKVTSKSGGRRPIKMEGGDAGLISQSILINVERRKNEKEKSKEN